MPTTVDISKSSSTGLYEQEKKTDQCGRLSRSARSIQQIPHSLQRKNVSPTPSSLPSSEKKCGNQCRISAMRVLTGCLLGAAVGVIIGGPIGIGVGAVVGGAYILIGPKAMWQVIQNAGRAIATHISDYRAKRSNPTTA